MPEKQPEMQNTTDDYVSISLTPKDAILTTRTLRISYTLGFREIINSLAYDMPLDIIAINGEKFCLFNHENYYNLPLIKLTYKLEELST